MLARCVSWSQRFDADCVRTIDEEALTLSDCSGEIEYEHDSLRQFSLCSSADLHLGSGERRGAWAFELRILAGSTDHPKKNLLDLKRAEILFNEFYLRRGINRLINIFSIVVIAFAFHIA